MPYYLIGLGSNINPEYNLDQAHQRLARLTRMISGSPAVITTPVGDSFHYPFSNQLLIIHSPLDAMDLKRQLQEMEIAQGREPKSPERKHHDRPIDIDILYCADSLPQCLAYEPEDSYFRDVMQAWRLHQDQLVNV